jgi:hypothetical protein
VKRGCRERKDRKKNEQNFVDRKKRCIFAPRKVNYSLKLKIIDKTTTLEPKHIRR